MLCKNNANVFCQLLKNTGNKNSSVVTTIQNRLMLASNCAVCGEKKLKFNKNQEASRCCFLLIKFEMITLKQIKLSIPVSWLETSLFPNCFSDN